MGEKSIQLGTEDSLKYYEEQLQIAKTRRDEFLRTIGDYDRNKSDGYRSSSFVDELNVLDADIRYLQHIIDSTVLIDEKQLSDEKIGIDDIVTFQHVGEDERIRSVQLTAIRPFIGSATELSKITINSPLGKCLMGAQVGEVRSYSAGKPAKEYTIIILSKTKALEKTAEEQQPGQE